MADRSEAIRATGIRDTRSMGEIVQSILRDIQDVLRSEFRLARAEMTEKAQRAGKAGALIGGAAVGGLLAAAAVVATCIAALALVVPVWLASLIMTVVLGCVAAVCFFAGRAKLRRLSPVPEQTVETLKEDVEWAKNQTR
jgi:protein-S-isoprenylcysteine O-methyltransferase Ste14